jgi:uncharacterized membrane protein YhaH (DUF805 family)
MKKNIKIYLENLLSTSGRIGSFEYLVLHFLSVLLFAILYFVILLLPGVLSIIFTPIIFIIYGMFAIIISIKRFHDFDQPGSKAFLLFIPLVNIYYGFQLLFKSGTKVKNKYGDPKIPFFNEFFNKSTFHRSLKLLVICFIFLFFGFLSYLNIDLEDQNLEIIEYNSIIEKNINNTDPSEILVFAEKTTSSELKIEAFKVAANKYMNIEDIDNAIITFKKAIDLVEKDSFDFHLINGELSTLEGDLINALYNFEIAYALNPNDYYINSSLGWFYLNSANSQYVDYNKAVNYLEYAYKLSPSVTSKESLAVAYYFSDQFFKSRDLFLELDNLISDPYIDFSIGLCYLNMDNLPLAQKYIKNAYLDGYEMEDIYIEFINTEI